jgi:hypothetical protein
MEQQSEKLQIVDWMTSDQSLARAEIFITVSATANGILKP